MIQNSFLGITFIKITWKCCISARHKMEFSMTGKELRLIQGLSIQVSKCPYSSFVPKQLERTPEYIGNSCACPFRIFLKVSVHWIVNLRSPCKQEVALEELWVIISYGYSDTLILLSYNLSFSNSRVDYWSVFFCCCCC